MLTTQETPMTTQDLLDRAHTVADVLTAHAARHDEEGSFVTEGFAALRDAGLLAIGVPTDLGGDGASPRQIAEVQRTLAHACGSTALASSMHQHVVAFTAWRYRRGLPGAEATLKRVADEGILLVSTGGGDWTRPRGEAVKVDGGYRVTGRKPFASQSPVGTVMSTMFVYDDPDQGRRVLNLAVPFAADGVRVLDNWDTLGMRGTASNDIVLDDVFVPDERVLANRPYGTLDPPLQVIGSIAMPIITAVYLGIAEAAHAAALDCASPAGRSPVRSTRSATTPSPRWTPSPQPWPPSARSPSPASRSATSPWSSPVARRSPAATSSNGATATSAPPSSTRSRRTRRCCTPASSRWV
jgi:alkylation response protein AidB-like acyl-CoA dehydrogenase